MHQDHKATFYVFTKYSLLLSCVCVLGVSVVSASFQHPQYVSVSHHSNATTVIEAPDFYDVLGILGGGFLFVLQCSAALTLTLRLSLFGLKL
ncbi:hypothetical protein BCR33DRAFT_715914 [Rhizoclosmatium globosum]|uniref:Uncharacterized protein n=1 Tax=Rhizoclosmatium globosum TaxID=329046 RepID=A0A1Y2CFQ5_9FUNG|nr:hypothetical protein BCR33DRAFT_715914 [Rhizoclosmatium globosum]|eukprot:ORY45881.1 hypothetical protein BCR33DRAFT_715914 [Rhizoclosmatium globosum]